MSSTNNHQNTNSTAKDDDDDYDDENCLRIIEEFAMLSSTTSTVTGEEEEGKYKADEGVGRRRSRASVEFFQRETSKAASSVSVEVQREGGDSRRKRNSFIGLDGKVQDTYITKRASLNKPNKSLENVVPMLVDLTTADTLITRIDGKVLSQLFISGYAKLDSKVDELNRINVYPIADGDTGANMKVCLKLPSRNLILDQSSNSIARVSSNMAADVLLNGQGNSGTILSHFFVSLAEEINDRTFSNSSNNKENDVDPDSLSIDEFAMCLAKTGEKMADAVTNPQEGTIISVSRDACAQLWTMAGDGDGDGDGDEITLVSPSYSNLKKLLESWNNLAQNELQKTPDQLIVNGVKVLEKAGVVDSGAQGFVYLVEGMLLACEGKLPEAFDPNLFKTGVKHVVDGDHLENLAAVHDHTVCDSKYQFCTEAVILLKDGFTKKDVMDMIDTECKDLGDSVAIVGAPAKEGGNMCKCHIHTDDPQQFFDKFLPYSRGPIYKKEKVEDMKIMRELEHGEEGKARFDLSQASFTILGAKYNLPSPEKDSEDIFAFPLFIVPANTGEPIDVRYASETDALIAHNQQRNKSTAIKYSTAAANPMQMKIELLAALSKGKPVLVFVFSLNKKLSSMGRNALLAIDMLDPKQQQMVKVLVHGSFGGESMLLIEAIQCAKEGKDIDETYAICDQIADQTSQALAFYSSDKLKQMKAFRPALFPDEVIDGTIKVTGTSGSVYKDGCPVDKRMFLEMAQVALTNSLVDAFKAAVKHIKDGLLPGQKIGNVMIPCVGRSDIGNKFLTVIKEAGIEIVGTPRVYNEGIFAICFGNEWGGISLRYKIVEK